MHKTWYTNTLCIERWNVLHLQFCVFITLTTNALLYWQILMHNFSVPIGPMWSFISTRPESRDFKTPKPHRKHFYLVCFYLITLFYLYSRYFRKYGFQNVTCKWERDRRGRDCMVYVGDRPFNLQGGGGMVCCFVQNKFFGHHEG